MAGLSPFAERVKRHWRTFHHPSLTEGLEAEGRLDAVVEVAVTRAMEQEVHLARDLLAPMIQVRRSPK